MFFEPYLAVEQVGEDFHPLEGTPLYERTAWHRISIGIAWPGKRNTYSLSTGFTYKTRHSVLVVPEQ